MRTIGRTPPSHGILLAHHDQQTFAWSEALLDIVVKDADGNATPTKADL
jgi:hypothetical protein